MIYDEIDETPAEYMVPYVENYICCLDDPVLRRIALALDFAKADRIFKDGTWSNTSEEHAVRCIASKMRLIYAAVADLIGETMDVVGKSYTLWEALHDLALNISTRDDRIIACRQLYSYPCLQKKRKGDDGTLDENAHHVAMRVHKALYKIGKEIERLQKEVKA